MNASIIGTLIDNYFEFVEMKICYFLRKEAVAFI